MEKMEERETVTLVNKGEKIFGVIHRPLNKTRVPAVIVCPGFAGTKCGKFRLFVRLGQELAKRGIAVFRFDYRGAGDSEGEFNDITLEGKIEDTLACLDFIAKDSQIDPNRIGLLGRSLGGVVSILAARRYENIKSLALWAPVFNSEPWKVMWQSFKSQQSAQAREELLQQLPMPIPNKQFLNEFFAIHLKEELEYLKSVPLLHIHGERDAVVKIEHAEGYQRVRASNELSKFIRLPHSNHDFSDFDEQKIALAETSQWYQQTL